jgi:5'-methylthioadenosine phosphorylase
MPEDFSRKLKIRLKSLEKPRIAIIGGIGFEQFFKQGEQLRFGTPYGIAPSLSIEKINGEEVIFLPRHGPDHSVPPHKINYRANVFALHEIGVVRTIAVNAVGAINRDFKPGDVVIPHDFVDFTKHRPVTFYDDAPVTHVDVSQPYCPEIRGVLIETARKLDVKLRDRAVLVCTEGPRFETPAEIQMFRVLGCDVVGMTNLPEAVLTRELGMCYAALCFVSNMAAGIQERLVPFDVSKVSVQIMPKLQQLLIGAVRALPLQRKGNCSCADALKNARVKG